MENFSVQVGRWCDLAGDRSRLAFIAIAYAALEAVKRKTPVDTGYLRANWQIVKGDSAIPVERVPRQKAQEAVAAARVAGDETSVINTAAAALKGEGSAPRAMEMIVGAAGGAVEQQREVAKVQLGDVLRIVNPTSYARDIEFGRQVQNASGGTTHTRPQAMVQRTISEMPEIAARALAPFLRGG